MCYKLKCTCTYKKKKEKKTAYILGTRKRMVTEGTVSVAFVHPIRLSKTQINMYNFVNLSM